MLRGRKARRLAVGLVLGMGLIAADWYLANREMNNVLTAMEASEAALVAADDGLDAAVEASVANDDGRLDPPEERALERLVPEAARQALPAVVEAAADVEDVMIFPWHTTLDRARDRYLDHSDAWEARLTRVAGDYRQLAAPSTDIATTFARSARTTEQALRPLPLFDATQRIDAIYAQ